VTYPARRRSRSAGERLLEVRDNLGVLAARFLCREPIGQHQVCDFAAAQGWRLLVVRDMVRCCPVQAATAALHYDGVDERLRELLLHARWGWCSDLDEAVLDLRTVLDDIGDVVGAGRR
jgi:hypothetical protein